MLTLQRSPRSPSAARAGSVLVVALLLLLALGSLAAAFAILNARHHDERSRSKENLKAFCVAEAGLNEAYTTLIEHGFAGVQALEYPKTSGSTTYQVQMIDGREDPSIDIDRVRLRATGSAGRDPAGVELMVWHVPTGAYEFAAFGTKGVIMHSNTSVDSFDSNDGPYDPDAPSGHWGNVGSYGTLSIDSNVTINGDTLVGPDGVFDDDSSGIEISGDHESRELTVELPVIGIPLFPTLGSLVTAGTVTIPAGDHHYTALDVNKGKLVITGPGTLVVDDLIVRAGTEVLIDATNGPVEIYATGDFELRSNSKVTTNTNHARDVSVYITSSNLAAPMSTIEFASNAEFMGTVYAPAAKIKLSSNFEVYGALKGEYVELASNTHVHFDEDLLYDPDAADIFQRASWRRLSLVEVTALEP